MFKTCRIQSEARSEAPPATTLRQGVLQGIARDRKFVPAWAARPRQPRRQRLTAAPFGRMEARASSAPAPLAG
jgi:hypothetical protein